MSTQLHRSMDDSFNSKEKHINNGKHEQLTLKYREYIELRSKEYSTQQYGTHKPRQM